MSWWRLRPKAPMKNIECLDRVSRMDASFSLSIESVEVVAGGGIFATLGIAESCPFRMRRSRRFISICNAVKKVHTVLLFDSRLNSIYTLLPSNKPLRHLIPQLRQIPREL